MHKCSSSQLSIHNSWPTSKRANLQGNRKKEDDDLSQLGSFSDAEVNHTHGASVILLEVVGKAIDTRAEKGIGNAVYAIMCRDITSSNQPHFGSDALLWL